jgi:hypothetical protein
MAAEAAGCMASASAGASDQVPHRKKFPKNSGAARIVAFFERFLHVFLGLQARRSGDLLKWLGEEEEEEVAKNEAAGGEKSGVGRREGAEGKGTGAAGSDGEAAGLVAEDEQTRDVEMTDSKAKEAAGSKDDKGASAQEDAGGQDATPAKDGT